MRRALGVMVFAALSAVVPLQHEGDRALAQPLPPVITPVPEVPATTIPPTSAPTLELAPGQCDAVLPQALAELDFWRTQGTPVATSTLPLAGATAPFAAWLADSRERPRVAQVASAVKEMKPQDAALVVADWDDGLATAVLARLPARAAGAICAALPPAHAARLLARLSLLAVTEDAP